MTDRPLTILVLAAGLGTRMRSDLPKVLHPVAGKPMLAHVLALAESLNPAEIRVIAGPEPSAIDRLAKPHPLAIQAERLGTGHAVRIARDAGAGFQGRVLVLYGDSPLLTRESVQALLAALEPAGTALAVAGMRPADPARYGRLVVSPEGGLERIVEYAEATEAERALPLVNAGLMALDGPRIGPLLDRLQPSGSKGELYLTDLVGLARAEGHAVGLVEIPEVDALGANDRVELAGLEAILQRRLRRQALLAGVSLVAPETVFLSADTRFGRDCVVEPHVVFGPGVSLGDRVTVKAFSHLEGAVLEPDVVIGPYARLRPGTHLGAGVRIGNFVETKQAAIARGAKVNHLSYIGDAAIGEDANIGAGTITCNYDGFAKHRTEIGARAFIGSNTALVAPVRVGEGAITGAGSTITRDVPEDALAVTRSPQQILAGWAAAFRRRKAPRG